jgi:hypothetical protein
MRKPSSFHLSITVLFCYRSPPRYLALDEIYHPFGLHSQTTRLLENVDTYWHVAEVMYGTLTLYEVPFSEAFYLEQRTREGVSLNYNSGDPETSRFQV